MPASASLRRPPRSAVPLAGGVEAAFGGALLPPLGHDAGGMRAHLAGDATISGVAAISKLSGFADALLEPDDIVVDDVAAILAQMRGDAVGAGRNRDLGGLDRIGMPPSPRVTHGRDVVDVDAEADGGRVRGHEIVSLLAREPASRSRARRWRPPSSPAIAR
jgi:hypothetical protein